MVGMQQNFRQLFGTRGDALRPYISGRSHGVAPCHEKRRNPRSSCGDHIFCAVSHHPQLPKARPLTHLQKCIGSRLGPRHPIRTDNIGKMVQNVILSEHGAGGRRGGVRTHIKFAAGSLQRLDRLFYSVERSGVAEALPGIVLFKDFSGFLLVDFHTVEPFGNPPLFAVEYGGDLFGSQRIEPIEVSSNVVDGYRDVSGGIDQRTVEIEEDRFHRDSPFLWYNLTKKRVPLARIVLLLFLTLMVLRADALPVRFVGNRHVDSAKLYEVMGIPKPLFFEFWKSKPKIDPDRAKTLLPAVEAYYKSRGFYHARANSEVKKGVLVVKIEEGDPIRVESVATISPLRIRGLIPFKKGSIFDADLFVKSKEKIRSYYADHHYCNAQLNAKAFVDIERDVAYLVYDVTPNRECRFGKIDIKTSPTVEPRIVRSLLLFKEGELYSAEKIRRSYREIYANEGVERVVIDDTKHDGNVVPVRVEVTAYERPVHFTAGAGYSSDEGINLQAGVKHRNFLGNLKTLGIDARFSQLLQFVRLSGEMPLPRHNRLGFQAGYAKEIFDGYDEHSIKAKLNLKQLQPPHYFEEGILFDRVDTRNSQDPENFPNGTIQLVSPSLAWEIDTRDRFLDPTRGYRLRVSGMGSLKAGPSDATYYKIEAGGAYHKNLHWAVASFRMRIGSIDVLEGRVPPSYRFYAGGMNSNRAWRYRQLGPKNRFGDPVGAYSIVEATAELRMPLGESFRWVLFSDVTYLGEHPTPDFGRPYIAVGPGIRYMSPMGPIAFDIGFNTEDWGQYAVHFHIGELF